MSVPAPADGTPLWLAFGTEPLYAVLHSPPDGQLRDLAVLLLPPFGWDQLRSYRPRRQWAIALANAGFTVARIDLPGTEESVGSPIAPGRARSWKEAVASAAEWLKETSGARRVAAIGIGLGGLLALEAVSDDAPIDDLILWAVPARGRTSLRELQAYAALVSSSFGEAERSGPAPDGALELAGYPISEETAQWLGALDVTKLPLPHAERRRVLMIERDARGVDNRLRAHLEQSGAEVSVLAASDYVSLTTHAQAGEVPRQSIAGSIAWLQDRSGVRGAATRRAGGEDREFDHVRVRRTKAARVDVRDGLPRLPAGRDPLRARRRCEL